MPHKNFKILSYCLSFPAAKRHFGWTVRWMARLNGGKAQTSMSPHFFQEGGIKTFCGEISQYSKKCSPYFLTVSVVQCTVCFSTSITVIKRRWHSHVLKDVFSYAYYGHFIFPLRLLKMDMNVTH